MNNVELLTKTAAADWKDTTVLAALEDAYMESGNVKWAEGVKALRMHTEAYFTSAGNPSWISFDINWHRARFIYMQI